MALAPLDTLVEGSNGAKVTLSNALFTDSQGNPATLADNDIQVTITPVDISTPAGLAVFPGELAGITANGQDAPIPIVSYGTVEYQFTLNGQVLDFSGVAEIEIPLSTTVRQNGDAIVVGEAIPLWSLNEETGIWLQETTGIVVASESSATGLALRAQVYHFTWWAAGESRIDTMVPVVTLNSEPEKHKLFALVVSGSAGGSEYITTDVKSTLSEAKNQFVTLAANWALNPIVLTTDATTSSFVFTHEGKVYPSAPYSLVSSPATGTYTKTGGSLPISSYTFTRNKKYEAIKSIEIWAPVRNGIEAHGEGVGATGDTIQEAYDNLVTRLNEWDRIEYIFISASLSGNTMTFEGKRLMREYYTLDQDEIDDPNFDIEQYYISDTDSTESVELTPTQYVEFGATGVDDSEGNLPIETVITRNGVTVQEVDTSQVGTYTITYSATNSMGNTGTAVRTVVVE